MFNPVIERTSLMKTWIKRSLIGLGTATFVLLGVSACGHRDGHSRGGWSETKITEMRAKALDKVEDKLKLDASQKVKLGVLADEMLAARQAVRGQQGGAREQLASLIAGPRFERGQAQQMLDQKMGVMQNSGPKLLDAFAGFYDSLEPEQQQQVRQTMTKRGGWWGRS